jgi:hypothetical protein
MIELLNMLFDIRNENFYFFRFCSIILIPVFINYYFDGYLLLAVFFFFFIYAVRNAL